LCLREIQAQGDGENYIVMSFTLCGGTLPPNIIVMMNSKGMSQAENATLIEEQREAYTVRAGNPEGREPHGKSRLGWRIILVRVTN
jgi:hypothetical protein